MRTLSGRTVALLEGRQSSEIAAMVSRLGGTPISAPAVRERPSLDPAGPLLARLIDGTFPLAIVQTGAGASALFGEAERRNLLREVREAMGRMTLVCRGPKPQAALKKHGLTPAIVTARPHTTHELLEALQDTNLDRVAVLLLHYGERNTTLAEALLAQGALVEDVCLYEWTLPEDLAPLRDVVRRTVAGEIDALLFTSQIQFRFLLQIAHETGEAGSLVKALNEQVIVGAIGPVCAAALRAGGVASDVLPASHNCALLVSAIADYFELTSGHAG